METDGSNGPKGTGFETHKLAMNSSQKDIAQKWAASRTCVCLVCRSALVDNELCEEHPRGAVQLAVPAHREVLLEHVWGKATPRKASQRIGKVLCGLAVVSSLAGSLGALWMIQLGGMGLGLLAIPFLMAKDRHATGGRRLLARPEGLLPSGANQVAQLLPARQISGIVQDAPQLRAPLRNQLSVAFSVVLSHPNASQSPTVFRDARTLGFRLVAGDGTIVDIPPGKVFIDNLGDKIDLHHARKYLTELDPAQSRDGLDPFPFDEAYEAVVAVGDSVAVLSPLKLVPLPSSTPGMYRETPSSSFVPEGIPRLRVL